MRRRNRRRRREQKTQYLPGVTWKDVLARKPVTAAEVAKRENPGPSPLKPYRCRDCSQEVRLRPSAKAGSPRCMACGGILDPLTPENP